MAFLGRHLRGSHYRVTGLPSQAELGRRFFGWRRQHVNEVVAELKQAFWLDTSGDGYSMPCCYLIRSPQMALELNKTRAKASKPCVRVVGHISVPLVGQQYNYSLLSSNPVVTSKLRRRGADGRFVVVNFEKLRGDGRTNPHPSPPGLRPAPRANQLRNCVDSRWQTVQREGPNRGRDALHGPTRRAPATGGRACRARPRRPPRARPRRTRASTRGNRRDPNPAAIAAAKARLRKGTG